MRSVKLGAMAIVLAAAGGTRIPLQAAIPTESGQRKPNVILIVADDLGYGELGCYGGKEIPTPNIDSLAKEGVRLTDGYVTCPVCAPTRAGLLTGRYGPRFGFEFNPGPQTAAAAQFGLPKTEKTLAERLSAVGYATGMVGKWHLGYNQGLTPPDRGFGSFFGFLGGAHAYRGSRGASILRGNAPVKESAYLTYAFAREAVSFIQANKTRPFFLYLPFNAVHAPLQAPQRMESRFAAITNPKRKTFAGMLTAMDEAVGQVLGTLKKEGLDENTLIVFIGDNGGPTPQTTSGNGPLRGFKGQTFEGGIRVPYIYRWKGRFPAGKVFAQPAISLDIVPTVMTAADAPAPSSDKLDGVNLLDFLTGKADGRPHEHLYWRFGAQRAIRAGDWKLVTSQGVTDALFDLSKDPGEKQNLAASDPGRVRDLKAHWETWSKTLMEPKWGRQGRRVKD